MRIGIWCTWEFQTPRLWIFFETFKFKIVHSIFEYLILSKNYTYYLDLELLKYTMVTCSCTTSLYWQASWEVIPHVKGWLNEIVCPQVDIEMQEIWSLEQGARNLSNVFQNNEMLEELRDFRDCPTHLQML